MLTELKPAEIAKIQSRYRDLLNYDSDDVSDLIDPLQYKDSGGDTLLHIAAYRGDSSTVKILLRAGLDPNLKGDMGNTPLHYAGEQNHGELVHILQEHGARTDIPNDFGTLPETR